MISFKALRQVGYPVTTVVGSSRFAEDIKKASRMLTLMHHQVLTMHVFGHAEGIDKNIDYADLKRRFDAAYMDKIDRSDSIFVVNPKQYIGMGTMDEILYAVANNKVLMFQEPILDTTCCREFLSIYQDAWDMNEFPDVYPEFRQCFWEEKVTKMTFSYWTVSYPSHR